MDDIPPPESLSAYEQRRWDELCEHWREAAARRMKPPNPVTRRMRQTGAQVSQVAARGIDAVGHAVHASAEHAHGALDRFHRPADAVVHVLNSVTALTSKLTDPHTVIASYGKQSVSISALADIRALDLETVEAHDRHLERHWRSVGLLEGGAIGTLSLIPVPAAGLAAISFDLLVIHALSLALATNIAHSFGFERADLDPADIINAIAQSSVLHDAVQSEGVSEVGAAGDALVELARGMGTKLAEDPRVAKATEDLVTTVGEGEMVAMEGSATGIPIVGMLLGAGLNQHALGRIAHEGRQYAATLFLMTKYGLPVPEGFPDARSSTPQPVSFAGARETTYP